MKYLTLAIAALAGLSASKAIAQTPIYDIVNPGAPLFFYGGAGNNVSGDNYLPPAGPWTVTDLEFVVVAQAPGIYPVTINFYNTVNAAPPPIGPAFGAIAFTLTGNINIPAGGPFPAAYGITVTGLSVPLPNPPGANGLGIDFSFGNAPNLSTAYSDVGSSVAGSAWSNGFFVDLNTSTVLDNNEFVNFGGWTNGNVVFRLAGTSPVTSIAQPFPFTAPEFNIQRLAARPVKAPLPLGTNKSLIWKGL